MTGPTSTVQAADGGPIDLQAVAAALATHFTVAPGPRHVVDRAHLDTFDRRLRAAGLSLEQHTAAARAVLVLGRADASPVRTAVTGLRWPSFGADLPEGPVRDVVAPVSGIRALLVVSSQQRRVCRVDLRNSDAKVVARLELDEPVSAEGTSPRLSVLALRGYDDQARRAAQLLADLGMRAVEQAPPASDDAVATVAIDFDATATELMAVELAGFLGEMRENLPGLLADVDTEFLHDFRVAVRRTRATLKLGRPVLPPAMRSRWEPAFKWLGDLTTPVRDLDVYELDLPAMAGWLQAAEPADLEPFAAHLRSRRDVERRTLVRGLRSARFDRLVTQWRQALADLASTAEPEQLSAVALSELSIARAFRRVARDGAVISAESPPEDLHTLRKRCKELRYALEVFAPVIDKDARKQAVGDLKGLQDVLGRFQDSEVQRQSLKEYAEQMVAHGTPAGAVLAMGELTGHLDAEQHRARREFDDAFARFVRPASSRRMHQIGGGR